MLRALDIFKAELELYTILSVYSPLPPMKDITKWWTAVQIRTESLPQSRHPHSIIRRGRQNSSEWKVGAAQVNFLS